MRPRQNRLTRVVGCLFVIACLGCGDKLLLSAEVASISISPGPDTAMLIGSKVQLAVILKNAAGQTTTTTPPASVQFTSRDVSRITVDSTGLITAPGTGSTYVIATWGAPRVFIDSAHVTIAASR